MDTSVAPLTHPRPAPEAAPPFSFARSLGWAGTLALHLVLWCALLMPIAAPEHAAPEPVSVRVHLEALRPLPVVPPGPPEPVQARQPSRSVTPVAPSPVVAPLAAEPTASEAASPLDIPANPGTETIGDGAEVEPASAGLQLLSGPEPRYPRAALARGLEGDVELMILVGPDGVVVEATVARSSGHMLLDRAAREHVKRHWRFMPPLQSGQPVSAWARLPVRFRLPAG